MNQTEVGPNAPGHRTAFSAHQATLATRRSVRKIFPELK